MSRKRVRRRNTVYVLTGDFAQGLEAFKEASGLPWAEIARLLGTSVLNLWRWRKQGVQPNMHHPPGPPGTGRRHGPGPPAADRQGPTSAIRPFRFTFTGPDPAGSASSTPFSNRPLLA